MISDKISKAACVLMLIGFAAGIILQIELLKPGISFLSDPVWPHLITLHIWATVISLLTIILSTFSFIRYRETFGLWGIWLGFCLVPILIGVLLHVMLKNASEDSYYLSVSLYVTAYRHAFGVAVLLAALGGLSALNKVKLKTVSLTISFSFALLITAFGIVLTVLQASIGINGLPKGYVDYPYAFAQLQFYSGLAAMACLSLSAAYVVYLWRCPVRTAKVEEVF